MVEVHIPKGLRVRVSPVAPCTLNPLATSFSGFGKGRIVASLRDLQNHESGFEL